jgi:hypothetical protein
MPFLAFPSDVRRVIYTTDKTVNFQRIAFDPGAGLGLLRAWSTPSEVQFWD